MFEGHCGNTFLKFLIPPNIFRMDEATHLKFGSRWSLASASLRMISYSQRRLGFGHATPFLKLASLEQMALSISNSACHRDFGMKNCHQRGVAWITWPMRFSSLSLYIKIAYWWTNLQKAINLHENSLLCKSLHGEYSLYDRKIETPHCSWVFPLPHCKF